MLLLFYQTLKYTFKAMEKTSKLITELSVDLMSFMRSNIYSTWRNCNFGRSWTNVEDCWVKTFTVLCVQPKLYLVDIEGSRYCSLVLCMYKNVNQKCRWDLEFQLYKNLNQNRQKSMKVQWGCFLYCVFYYLFLLNLVFNCLLCTF